MCIRDRSESALALDGPSELSAIIAEAKSLGVPEATLNDPVSYTHLRAHETVLDLVCRLLLDTKNRS